MANRFTDTEKWGDSWFRNLPWGWKSVWLYLCGRCDHAGIIKIDLELLNFYIKPDKPLDIEQILGAINNGKERVIRVDDSRLYLTQFVEFQYKGGFNPNNNAHLGVVKLLRRYQLTKHLPRGWSGANKGLVRGSVATKDKDKDKEDTKYIDTANKVIDYFNKTTESSYKHSSTARGPIIARLKDGFTGRQCAEVIHKKHHQWKDDDKMCKYIRITTLFQPTKFEGYLNEKTVVEPEKRML